MKSRNLLLGYFAFLAILIWGSQLGRDTAPARLVSPLPQNPNSAVFTAKTTYQQPALAAEPERQRNIKLIRWVFGKNADTAIRVFTCESGLRSSAVNDHNTDGLPDVGLAQIHVYPSHPFTAEEMKNPVANLHVAKDLFDHRGWQPWASSNACHHVLDGKTEVAAL